MRPYDGDHAIGGQRGDRRCPARGAVLRLVHRDRGRAAHRPGTGATRSARSEFRRRPRSSSSSSARPPCASGRSGRLPGHRGRRRAAVRGHAGPAGSTTCRPCRSAVCASSLVEERCRGRRAPEWRAPGCRSTSPCGSTASSTRSVTQRLLYTFRQATARCVLVDDRDAAARSARRAGSRTPGTSTTSWSARAGRSSGSSTRRPSPTPTP